VAPTPEKPQNAYGGAEQSAEQQKRALVELLASQGNAGKQLIENRGQDASAIAAAAKSQWGDASMPVQMLYQTFGRDARQATSSHQNEQARMQQAHQAYMDQVAAGVPMLRQEGDNYIERMRLEYEDRQRQREAEEQARAEEMQMRREAHAASMASSRSRGGSDSNALIKALEERAIDRELSAQDFANLDAGSKKPSLARNAGAQGGKRDILQAAKDIGFDVKAAEKRWVKGDPKSQFYQQDQALKKQIEIEMQEALANDVPWAQVLSGTRLMAEDLGLNWEANFQPWLAVYSPLWGITDAEWVVNIPKGPGYRPPARPVEMGPYRPSDPRSQNMRTGAR
jgi:hypothetical protein